MKHARHATLRVAVTLLITAAALMLPIAGWGPTLSPGHTFGLSVLGGSDTAADDFQKEASRWVPEVAVHLLRPGNTLVLRD